MSNKNNWRPIDDFETAAYLQYPEHNVSFESYMREAEYGLRAFNSSSDTDESVVPPNGILSNKATSTKYNENKYNTKNFVTSEMKLAELIKPYKRQKELIGNPLTVDDILNNGNKYDEITGMIREYGLGHKSNTDYVFNSSTTRKTVDSKAKYIIDGNKPILLDSEYFKMIPKNMSSRKKTNNVQSNRSSDVEEQFKSVFVDKYTTDLNIITCATPTATVSNASSKEKQFNDNNIINEIAECKLENDEILKNNKTTLFTPKQLYDLKRKSKNNNGNSQVKH